MFINSGKREHPMREHYETIDEYIEIFPKDVQAILRKMRQTIKQVAPGAVEAISYGMPTFKLNGRNLVHFAAFKSHIGFYPIPTGIEAFKQELSPYKQGRGSVQFPLDKPIPYGLVERIVKYRVKGELKIGKSSFSFMQFLF